jgi:nucleotide-binding universal stress UspA family protein
MTRPWPANSTFCVLNSVDIMRLAGRPPLVTQASKEGEHLVKESAAVLSRVGWPVLHQVVVGSPRHAIPLYAEEWRADLILIGSHGQGAIARFLLGSVAQGILRKARCSVEIVRALSDAALPSSHAMKILVATDGSECSLAAVHSVARRPWPAGTLFQVLSVEELVPVSPLIGVYSSAAFYPATLVEEIVEESRARASAAEELARKILARAGLKMESQKPLAVGDPRSIILDIAQTWPADLIVLGSHGRSRLDRILLGSVSEAVAVHAHCSVEVIRTSAAEAEAST